MRLGCILVLIGVLFASSRANIHHISTLMLNAIEVTLNESWQYNMRKLNQNSLKKHAKNQITLNVAID